MKPLRNIRIWILIIAIVLMVAAINPRPWQTGATIRNVDKESAAFEAGFAPSSAKTSPVLRERVIAVNDQPVRSAADFEAALALIPANTTVRIETNKQDYLVTTRPLYNVTVLPEMETVNVTEEVFDNGTFTNVTKTVTRHQMRRDSIGVEPIGLFTYDAPKTNIRLGLDLSGGARVLLRPEQRLEQEELDALIDTIKERLNIYGLSDIVVRPVKDLAGNQFVLIEVAGASERDVRELTQQQGKFEAKIGNETVFRGGKDITYVCRSPQCSGFSERGCQPTSQGYACEFRFEITLTPEAAQRQADVTRNLAVVPSPSGEQYLERPLDLYLDDAKVDTLQIGASLRGNPVTSISISGSGAGANERAAIDDSLANMKKLQTVLQTGSLPVKLEVVKTDAVSAELGDEFIKNSLFVGMLAFITVTVIMVVRFRNPKISIPVLITLISELLIILGVAALFGQNLDLAAIAGILIAIGTGVDDQIVIVDETMSERGKRKEGEAWRARLRKAFFIIFAAYFTAMASLVPLLFAGAGLVRGFAITTMIGISAGVLVTRPAFAAIVERLEHEE